MAPSEVLLSFQFSWCSRRNFLQSVFGVCCGSKHRLVIVSRKNINVWLIVVAVFSFSPTNQRVTAISSPSNFSQWYSGWALLRKSNWLLSVFVSLALVTLFIIDQFSWKILVMYLPALQGTWRYPVSSTRFLCVIDHLSEGYVWTTFISLFVQLVIYTDAHTHTICIYLCVCIYRSIHKIVYIIYHIRYSL